MQSTALGVKPACRRAPPSGGHAQAERSHKANACAVPLAGSRLHSSRCKLRPVLALSCLSGIPSARVAPATGRQAGNPTQENNDSASRTDSFFQTLIFGLPFSPLRSENWRTPRRGGGLLRMIYERMMKNTFCTITILKLCNALILVLSWSCP